mgnify:CR=1 FL=1
MSVWLLDSTSLQKETLHKRYFLLDTSDVSFGNDGDNLRFSASSLCQVDHVASQWHSHRFEMCVALVVSEKCGNQ